VYACTCVHVFVYVCICVSGVLQATEGEWSHEIHFDGRYAWRDGFACNKLAINFSVCAFACVSLSLNWVDICFRDKERFGDRAHTHTHIHTYTHTRTYILLAPQSRTL